jgi:hypothetical protein
MDGWVIDRRLDEGRSFFFFAAGTSLTFFTYASFLFGSPTYSHTISMQLLKQIFDMINQIFTPNEHCYISQNLVLGHRSFSMNQKGCRATRGLEAEARKA